MRIPLAAFGAVGDGRDDTLAVLSALDSGESLSGGGLTYSVCTSVALLANTSLWDATFRQLDPSLTAITVSASYVDNLDLQRVWVDLGDDGTNGGTLNSSGVNGGLDTCYGMRILGGQGHYLEDIGAFGASSATGLAFLFLDGTSTIIRPTARDMAYNRNSATDDQLQGILAYGCSDAVMVQPRAYNLVGTLNGAPARRFTRGIAAGANKGLTIDRAFVQKVDQGIDISGGPETNEDVHVLSPRVNDAYIFGVKLANTAIRAKVKNGVVRDSGCSYVLNGNPSLTETTRDGIFEDCVSINASSNGQTVVARAAFRQMGEVGNAAAADTRYVRCHAIDNQSVKTMDYGFLSDVASISDSPIYEDCTSTGHIVAGAGGLFRPTRETGGNSNGAWEKLSDGTLRCWHTIDLTGVSMSTLTGADYTCSSPVSWNFPVQFCAPPSYVGGNLRRDDAAASGVTIRSPSAASANLHPWASYPMPSGNVKSLYVEARGRWY